MPRIDVLLEGYGLGSNVGTIGFCAVILIEGERRILFDSAHVGRRTFLLAALQRRGLNPTDIDAQVLSHAHWDHVQNCDLFDHAPMLLHPRERKYAGRPHRNDWATPKWTGAVIETMQLEEVGEGSLLMPGCRVIELPGHSPGSIGLEVETDEGRCLVVGDAIHNARVALAGRNPLVFWNEAQANASIERCTDSGALIYPGHDRPFRLKDGQVQYSSEFMVTVTGVEPGMPGVTFIGRPPAAEPWIMPGIEEQHLD
jgi:glyoxylase-like metal-dependent hydrolase (beta-lactamase superfamily II)